jgi:hypothetical protein
MRRGILTAILAANVVLSLSGALGQVPATNGVTPSPSSPVVVALSPDTPTGTIDNNKVLFCKYESPTGSHIAIPVCRTKLAWEHIHTDSRQYLEDINRNAGMGNH